MSGKGAIPATVGICLNHRYVCRVEAMSDARVVAGCLAGVILSLLLVGIVSGTLARHVVQVIPALFALWLVLQRPAIGAYAAIPIFVFWALIMAIIWLYLLGLSDITEGSFSAVEVVLTVVIALFSVWGTERSLHIERETSLIGLSGIAILFLVLQVAFMAASLEFFG